MLLKDSQNFLMDLKDVFVLIGHFVVVAASVNVGSGSVELVKMNKNGTKLTKLLIRLI